MPEVLIWSGSSFSKTFNRQSVYLITLDSGDIDQTASLQAQLDAIPDGSGGQKHTIILPEGSYRIDGRIVLQNRHNLIIDGNGHYSQYTNLTGIEAGVESGGISQRTHWTINNCSDIQLRRLEISGSNDERDQVDGRYAKWTEVLFQEAGITIMGASNNILVEECDISNVHGDTFYVGGTGSPNQNIVIRSVIGRYPGRQGAGVVNVDGLTIEDVDVQWGGRSGLDIEPNHDTQFVSNVTLRRVKMGCKFYPFVIGGAAGDTGVIHVSNILLEDCIGVNTISSHAAVLANPHDGQNITIRRHTDLRQRSTVGLEFGNWSGTILVEDSVISSGPSTPTSMGLKINDCSAAVEIFNNTFNGPSGYLPGEGGADELYLVYQGANNLSPSSITHNGNVWNMGASNDGV